MKEQLKYCLCKWWKKNNHKKYHHYFEQWFQNLTDNQIYYFKKDFLLLNR